MADDGTERKGFCTKTAGPQADPESDGGKTTETEH